MSKLGDLPLRTLDLVREAFEFAWEKSADVKYWASDEEDEEQKQKAWKEFIEL